MENDYAVVHVNNEIIPVDAIDAQHGVDDVMPRNRFGGDLLRSLCRDKDDWFIHVKVVRSWTFDVGSTKGMEFVVIDEEGTRIGGIMYAKVYYRLKKYFQEGAEINVAEFGVDRNTRGFKTTTHPFFLSLEPGTKVTPLPDGSVQPGFWFQFFPIGDILSGLADPNVLYDVVGKVVWYSEEKDRTRPGQAESMLIDVLLSDAEKNFIKCTLWTEYAREFLDYAKDHADESIILAIMFARVKNERGEWSVGNSYSTTRLFMDGDMTQMMVFKESLKGSDLYLTPSKSGGASPSKDMQFNMLLNVLPVKLIGDISSMNEESEIVVAGTISTVRNQRFWYYMACRDCKSSVDQASAMKAPVCSNADCTADPVVPVVSFKVEVEIEDGYGFANLTLFDRHMERLTHWKPKDLHDRMISKGMPNSLPPELKNLKSKEALYVLDVTEKHIKRPGTYFTPDQVTQDEKSFSLFRSIMQRQQDEIKLLQSATPVKGELPLLEYGSPGVNEAGGSSMGERKSVRPKKRVKRNLMIDIVAANEKMKCNEGAQ